MTTAVRLRLKGARITNLGGINSSSWHEEVNVSSRKEVDFGQQYRL